MVEIVQNQPACRNSFQNFDSAGPGNILQLRIPGMKKQRDERVEAAGFILKGPDGKHVVHPVRVGFDMAEQHGYVGRYPKLMRLPHDIEILFPVNFFRTDFAPYRLVEYLPASSGERTKAAFSETFEHFAHGDILYAGDMFYFNRCKGLKVHSGKLTVEPGEHASVVVQTGGRMAAPYDMELAHLFVPELFRLLDYLLGREEKGAFLFRTTLTVSTKSAPVYTNVGVVNMQVIYVKDLATVFCLINLIGQTS